MTTTTTTTNDATTSAAAATRRPAGDGPKRLLDVLASAALLVVCAPIFVLLFVLVPLDSPGPALFRQQRVGKNGRRFVLLKFRTMRSGAPTLPTDQMTARLGASQVTRVGRFLRRASLDELPQLVNVLRGEMSLVGPRPALPMQEELNQRRRAAGVDALLPGVTGWAQINGRDELDTETKVACDRWYLDHRSLSLDLVIVLRTLLPVLSGRGNR